MHYPPYSSDIAPCDFWIFPKLKNVLKGQRFANLSDIQSNVKTLLRDIPENDFQDCFQQWHHRLTKCIASQGECFEAESSRQCTGKQILFSQGHSGNLIIAPRTLHPKQTDSSTLFFLLCFIHREWKRANKLRNLIVQVHTTYKSASLNMCLLVS